MPAKRSSRTPAVVQGGARTPVISSPWIGYREWTRAPGIWMSEATRQHGHPRPPPLELRATLFPGPMATLLPTVIDVVCESGDLDVISYRTSFLPDVDLEGDLDDAVCQVSDCGSTLLGLELCLANGDLVFFSHESESIFFAMTWLNPASHAAPHATSICDLLLAHGLLDAAVVERLDLTEDDGLDVLPLVHRAGLLAISPITYIERHVGPIEDVRALPWERSESLHDRIVLGRGSAAQDLESYIQSVLPNHRALAALIGKSSLFGTQHIAC